MAGAFESKIFFNHSALFSRGGFAGSLSNRAGTNANFCSTHPRKKGFFIPMADLTFTTIEEAARKELGISRDEYALCNYVQTWSAHPKNRQPGYCDRTRQQMAEFVGITERGLLKMLDKMESLGLVERYSPTKFLHRITQHWFETVELAKSRRKGEQSSPFGDGGKVNKVHPETGTKFTLEGEESSPLDVNKVHPHKEVNNDSHKESDKDSAGKPAHDGEVTETREKREIRQSIEALNYLNTLCRRNFSTSPENLKFARARLHAGATIETLMLIVEWAATTWKGQVWNGKGAEFYWRPATLFQAEKFDHYRQQAEMWKQGQNGKHQIGDGKTPLSITEMRNLGIYK